MERDASVRSALASAGWRQAIIWECALKGKGRLDPPELRARLTDWLERPERFLDTSGTKASDVAGLSVHAPETTQPDTPDR
jgi:DNA mismatch endonuclease, patch repair protein